MRRLAAALGAALLLVACGGSSKVDDRLSAVEEHLAEVESGTFSLSLQGTAEADGERTDPVGFEVSGPFEFGDDTFPKLEITYKRLRGADSNENVFGSDGKTAWVVNEGAVTPVGPDKLQGLRQGEGVAGAVPDLDLASWFRDPKLDGNEVTGEVDVAELLGDLQRIAAEIDGNQAGDEITGEGADRLQDLVRSSSIELVTEGDQLRSLHAVIDFGAKEPAAVNDALVAYSAPRLELRITYEPLDGPLKVDSPLG